MSDPRTEKLAQILVNHSAQIKPGDRVAIEATTAAEPLVRALCASILDAGGHPHLLLELTDQDEILFKHAKDAQLDFVPSYRKLTYDQFESRIRVHSSTNPRALSHVDPAKQKRRQKALSPSWRRRCAAAPTAPSSGSPRSSRPKAWPARPR
jgi:aminopeptidase